MSISVERAASGRRARGLGFLFIAACCWGLTYPVQKFLLRELPPFSARALCAGAGLLLGFGLAVIRGEKLGVPSGEMGRLCRAAMLNFGLFSVLLIAALIWLTASEAVICTYTMPIWSSLLAWVLCGERLSPVRAVALAAGFGGIVVLVSAEPPTATWDKLPGYACGLSAAWVFALGTLLSKHQPLRLAPVAGVAWQIAVGAIPALLLALTERPDWADVTPLGWAALAYCASVPMVIAYLAWFRALAHLPAATAAIGTLIAPIVGVSSAALLLGEPVGLRQLAALALTLFGVALAVRG